MAKCMIPASAIHSMHMLHSRRYGSWYVPLVISFCFTTQQLKFIQTPLLHHYHPAVSLHARQLLTSQPLTASADLSQNTLSHFLDRFVYKNPKKLKETESGPAHGKGASAMQPAASGVDASVGVKLMKGEAGDGTMVNEPDFLRRKAGDVPVDQVCTPPFVVLGMCRIDSWMMQLFFHKYFSRKDEKEKARIAKVGKRKNHDEVSDDDEKERVSDEDAEFTGIEAITDKTTLSKEEEEEEDEEEVDSDEEEGEIWKVQVIQVISKGYHTKFDH